MKRFIMGPTVLLNYGSTHLNYNKNLGIQYPTKKLEYYL